METRSLVRFSAVPRYGSATRGGSEKEEERDSTGQRVSGRSMTAGLVRPRGLERLLRLLADCVVAGKKLTK
jgi:hypothetical protein